MNTDPHKLTPERLEEIRTTLQRRLRQWSGPLIPSEHVIKELIYHITALEAELRKKDEGIEALEVAIHKQEEKLTLDYKDERETYAQSQVKCLQAELDSSLARIRELEQDKERLDWLELQREFAISPPHPVPQCEDECVWSLFHAEEQKDIQASTLRIAIDAARKEK